MLSQVTQLGPLQALTEPLELEVFVVDDGRDHPLVVLEVEDQELKLFTVKLAEADAHMGPHSSQMERFLWWNRGQGAVGEQKAVLGLAEMAGLQVGVAESEAVLAPLFDIGDLVSLLVLEEVALAQEIVGPVLVTTHLAHLRKQIQGDDIAQAKFGLVQTAIDIEGEGLGVESQRVLLAGGVLCD